MFLSYFQTEEHFIFLNLNICILATKKIIEIENVINFENLEACKGKKAA